MNETLAWSVWARDKSVLDGIRALQAFAARRNRTLIVDENFGCRFHFGGTNTFTRRHTLAEVENLLTTSANPVAWEFMAFLKREDEKLGSATLFTYIDVVPGHILLTVRGEVDIDLFEATKREIESIFGFAAQRISPSEITMRISPHPTVLIGCHFDDEGKAAARKLAEFLSLLRFLRVEIADSFRSEPIPGKIKSLIEKNDLYFAVVTGQRDHSWIVAEMSYALAKNKRLVLIVQEGCTFNPALAGQDLERLVFKKQIEETFIGILQEIRRLDVIGV
jgi:hypothetical protein